MHVTLLVLALAAGKFGDIEKCYQPNGQLEEKTAGATKTTTYKSEAEVAEGCNAKAIAKAKGASVADVKELAGIVQRNSNQQSIVPVYTAGISPKTKKAICDDGDAWHAMLLALQSPAGHPHSEGSLGYLGACWPDDKQDVVELLDGEPNAYVKEHVCKFLKGKGVAGKGC
jgi:hypothetical protein